MNEHKDLFRSIKRIAEQLQSLNRRAAEQYTPVVEEIIRSRERDAQRIERILDRLLDFCGDDAVLLLFRQLCRHYWDIDPVATDRYIDFYREGYDPEFLPTALQTSLPCSEELEADLKKENLSVEGTDG